MRLLLLIYAFAVPWCYGLISIGGNRIALTDVLLPLAAALFLTRLRLPLTNLQCVLLLYPLVALVAALGVIGTGVEGEVFLKTARLWGTFAPALLLTTCPAEGGDLIRYVKAFIAGSFVSLVIGIAGFYLGWEFTAAHQAFEFAGGDLLQRAGGVFQDSGAYGHLLASACVIALAFLPTFASRPIRVPACLLAVSVTALGLMVSVSRSAVIHLVVVGLAAVVLPAERVWWKRFALGATAAGFLVLAFTYFAAEDTMLGGLRNRSVEMYTGFSLASEVLDQTSSGRLTNWVMALDVWREHPLLGVGYKALVPLCGFPGDSTFMLALAETGIAGLLALLFLFGAFIGRAATGAFAGDSCGRALLLLWIGQVVHSLSADIITFSGSMTAVLLLGTAMYREIGRTVVETAPQ